MKPTKTLHDLGQSFWLDNITRSLVNSGTLHRYIEEFSVTGLTSNPTIFDHAIRNVAAGQCRIPVYPVELLAWRSTCWRALPLFRPVGSVVVDLSFRITCLGKPRAP